MHRKSLSDYSSISLQITTTEVDMCDPTKLYTIMQTAEKLQMNPEVVRRWLRAGKLAGVKVGSEWRIPETTFMSWFKLPGNQPAAGRDKREAPVYNGPKMCIKTPKWLEFSGLPALLNNTIGPHAWPVFKKIVELDWELGPREDYIVKIEWENFCERLGYPGEQVMRTLKALKEHNYIEIPEDDSPPKEIRIITPIHTPKRILDLKFKEGGIRGAPEIVFENECLRRYC